MSEYDFKKMDVTKKKASNSMSASNSTDSVSGSTSSNSVDSSAAFNVADNYGSFAASNMADTCTSSVSSSGASNSVSAFGDAMSAYGGSAGPQNVDFSSSKGASSSFSMSSGTSSSNSTGDCGTCHSLQGVECQATNCQYHHPGGQCSATSIVVQAPDADNKTDTFCNTFTPNSGY